MEEYKQIIAPVEIAAVEGSMKKIQLTNYYDFLNLETVVLDWKLQAENQIVQEGVVENLFVAPHEKKTITLPINEFEVQANTDYYLTLTVCQKADTRYALAGHEIKKVQIPLQIRKDEFASQKSCRQTSGIKVSGRAYRKKQLYYSKI